MIFEFGSMSRRGFIFFSYIGRLLKFGRRIGVNKFECSCSQGTADWPIFFHDRLGEQLIFVLGGLINQVDDVSITIA
jgi:hypothetical protein